MKILKYAFAGAFKELKKKIDPWVFYSEVTGTRPIKKIVGGEVERDIEDILSYDIKRRSNVEAMEDDHHIQIIYSSGDLKELREFADGYREVKFW